MADNPFAEYAPPPQAANPFAEFQPAPTVGEPPSEIPQRQGMDLAAQYAGVINRAIAPYVTAAAVPGGPLALAATDIASAVYNPFARMTGLPTMQSGSEAIRSLYPEQVFREPETPGQAILGAGLEAATGARATAAAAGRTAEQLNTLRQARTPPSTTENVLREISQRPGVAAATGFAAGAAPAAAVEYSEPGSIAQNPVVLTTLSALTGLGTAKVLTRGPQIAAQAAVEKGLPEKARIAAEQKLGIKTSPSLMALQAKADRQYAQLDRSGVAFQPASIGRMVDDIEAIATREAVAERPEIRAELTRLRNISNQSLTLSQLNTIRSELQKRLIKSDNANIRRVGREMTDGIDDFVTKATPADLISGNLAAGREGFFGARRTWRQIARAEDMEEIIRQARVDKKPFDQALRDRFSRLEQNTRKFSRFSPEEQEFISYVARGGKPAQFLSQFGETLELRSPFGGSAFALGGLGGLGLTQVNPSLVSIPAVAGGAALVYGAGRGAAGTANLLAQRRAMEMSAAMRGYRKEPITPGLLPSAQAPINFLAEQQRIRELGF